MGPLLESPSRPSLKSGLGPLARYGTDQDAIIGRRDSKMRLLAQTTTFVARQRNG